MTAISNTCDYKQVRTDKCKLIMQVLLTLLTECSCHAQQDGQEAVYMYLHQITLACLCMAKVCVCHAFVCYHSRDKVNASYNTWVCCLVNGI